MAGYLFSNKKLREQLSKTKDAEEAAKLLGKHLQKDGKKLAGQVREFVESDEVQKNFGKAKKYASKKMDEAKKEIDELVTKGRKSTKKAAKKGVKCVKKTAKKGVNKAKKVVKSTSKAPRKKPSRMKTRTRKLS